METFLNWVIILITFLFASFFVASEFALVKVRKSSLLELKEKGDKKGKQAEQALDILEHLNEYLSTAQVGITLTGLIVGWVGEATMHHLFVKIFGNSQNYTGIITVLSILVLMYMEVVLTELIPKSLAITSSLNITLAIAKPLHLMHTLVYPLIWIMNGSSNFILKLFGKNLVDEEGDILSQKEILLVSEESVLGGKMDKEDLEYMKKSFVFNDKIAKDIMTPITEVKVIKGEKEFNCDKLAKKMLKEGHTRYPVIENNEYIGYIYSKDLWKADFEENTVISKEQLVLPILKVKATVSLNELLQKMKNNNYAICLIEENEKAIGIITMEDIVEEFVGEIVDESDILVKQN